MPVLESHTLSEVLKLSQTDVNYGYEFRKYDDGDKVRRYVTSDAVNSRLRTFGIVAEKAEEPYAIPEKLAGYASIMLEHQLGSFDGQFEDHGVCGLYGDLTPESEVVIIGYARYYDMLATFYSLPFLYKNAAGNIEFHGSDFVHNDFNVVYPLSARQSANPIGANTIAVTADNKMLIYRQADDAHVNPGKLMPSGSGVASGHDFEDAGSTVLQDIVKHCAEFKLREECNIPNDCTMESHVLGMCRVPDGMNPDFFCYTSLSMTYDELVAAGGTAFDVVEGRDGEEEHLSDGLLDYIAEKNGEEPGAVSLQLYLTAAFLAEVCR